MPKFHKVEEELATQLEKWIYLLKHLEEFPQMPARFQDTVLEQAFEIAELAHLSEAERANYESSLKHYRDIINVIDTARLEGHAEGRAEGIEAGRQAERFALARQMKQDGVSATRIAQYTGLTAEEIESL